MFNISDSICDGADGANSTADDDSDNFMYKSSDSETDCDWWIFLFNFKIQLFLNYFSVLRSTGHKTKNQNKM